MVVYPPGFAAQELAGGRPLSHARIGWNSLTRNAIYSDVSVSSEEEGSARDAPLRPETYEFWQPSFVPGTWELFFGEDIAIDYVGIAAHTCGSSGNSVLVETTSIATPTEYTTFSVEHIPADNSPMLFLDAARSVGSVRVSFSNGEPPRVAVIYIGALLVMERSVQPGHRPLSLSRQAVMKPFLSRTGQFLGQSARSQGVTGGASFVGLSASWYRTYFEPFVQESINFPFFFAWHPETYPAEVAYAWVNGDIAPSQQLSSLVNVDLDMTGVGSG